MGLIFEFLYLVFGGGYYATRLTSEHISDRAYEKRRKECNATYDDIKARHCDRELERKIDQFLRLRRIAANDAIVKKIIYEMLKNEMDYISVGDSSVELTEKQIADLILSKFGKINDSLSWYFGVKTKVGANMDAYTVSKRVMQCVESNFRAATGEDIKFGVSQSNMRDDGNYYNSAAVIDGVALYKPVRIYESISIPFTPLSEDDLQKAGQLLRQRVRYFM